MNIDEWNEYFTHNDVGDELKAHMQNLYARIYCSDIMGQLYRVKTDDRQALISEARSGINILNNGLDRDVRLIRGLVRIIGFNNVCRMMAVMKSIRGL